MANRVNSAEFLIENRLREAANGDMRAFYDLGMIYSTGSGGTTIDLIEAHKWFNLAAVSGNEEAQHCRSEIAGDMTVREISIAQRAARDWLSLTGHHAA